MLPQTRSLLAIALGALLLVLAVPVTVGAADVEGGKDHPLIGRYEGSDLVGSERSDYDEVRLLEGPYDFVDGSTQIGPGFKAFEGRSFLLYYRLPQGRSSLEALRNYEKSLKAKGFAVLFTCATSDGSCFRSGQPDAGVYLGNAVGSMLTLPMLDGNYVHNWFEQQGRYLFARTVGPEGAIYAGLFFGESKAGNVVVVRVVETTEMDEDKIVFLNAGEIGAALESRGSVDLPGIQFDVDQATLTPDSQPQIDEIAKLLLADQALKLRVVGHTDDQGGAEHNLDLSRRRAATVAAVLVADYGIAPARLDADGVGLTAPVASNASEEGRRQNRRVELVAQ